MVETKHPPDPLSLSMDLIKEREYGDTHVRIYGDGQ